MVSSSKTVLSKYQLFQFPVKFTWWYLYHKIATGFCVFQSHYFQYKCYLIIPGDLFLCVHAFGSYYWDSLERLSDSWKVDRKENHHQRISGLRWPWWINKERRTSGKIYQVSNVLILKYSQSVYTHERIQNWSFYTCGLYSEGQFRGLTAWIHANSTIRKGFSDICFF